MHNEDGFKKFFLKFNMHENCLNFTKKRIMKFNCNLNYLIIERWKNRSGRNMSEF